MLINTPERFSDRIWLFFVSPYYSVLNIRFVLGAAEKMEPDLSPNASLHSQDANGEAPGSGVGSRSPKQFGLSRNDNGRVRKIQRVSRACDACKLRKSRCSGTNPCRTCVSKRLQCLYLSSYSRGRPPTPVPAASLSPAASTTHAGLREPTATAIVPETTVESVSQGQGGWPSTSEASSTIPRTQGQTFDSASGRGFFHRAWNALLATLRQPSLVNQCEFAGREKNQTQIAAGDKPFDVFSKSDEQQWFPERPEALDLYAFYFDVCIATYRFLHRPTVERWLLKILENSEQCLPHHHGVGELRTSIVFGILAIAKYHKAQSLHAVSRDGEALFIRRSDQLFTRAIRLVESATGFPNIESVQARLVQILYLLHTSRMNQAWYMFGITLQMITALGLHRYETRTRNSASKNFQLDYVRSQCEKRVFWVSYILDRYLCVLFGRPQHYHDDDIDQLFPDCVDDEDMTPEGARPPHRAKDCVVTTLVLHAKYVYNLRCYMPMMIDHVLQDY